MHIHNLHFPSIAGGSDYQNGISTPTTNGTESGPCDLERVGNVTSYSSKPVGSVISHSSKPLTRYGGLLGLRVFVCPDLLVKSKTT